MKEHETTIYEITDPALVDDTAATSLSSSALPSPPQSWTTKTTVLLKIFGRWFITPSGFLISLDCLNIVAWGGMLFLLLCNAAPAMCRPTCNDINSPRRIWIEIDSQILNALFCVTGLGFIPWRAHQLYLLLMYRGVLGRRKEKRSRAIQKLAKLHESWFRPVQYQSYGSMNGTFEEEGVSNVALSRNLSDPSRATGRGIAATAMWKLDLVVWCNVWKTFFQICLCGFMWGMNRHNRPSWATGLFIALACGVAGVGGVIMYKEKKRSATVA